jgi:hypothetical protein
LIYFTLKNGYELKNQLDLLNKSNRKWCYTNQLKEELADFISANCENFTKLASIYGESEIEVKNFNYICPFLKDTSGGLEFW